jgi:hypothetical protein
MVGRGESRFLLAAYLCAAAACFGSVSKADAADSIPRWDIAEICATAAPASRCPSLESQHRRAVFQRWEALPVADRTSCEKSIEASGQLSYRALLVCLEDRQLRLLEAVPHSASPSRSEDG